MACPVEIARRKQLEKSVPEIWNNSTMLYIGANENRFHYAEQLRESGAIIDVIEIDRMACEYLSQLDWVNEVIFGDMRNCKVLVKKQYDLIFWSHGPEIIERDYFETTMNFLESMTKNILVLMAPWGKYHYTKEQFENDQYPNIAALYEHDFQKLGFFTSVLGEKDVNGSNLLAWKYNEVSQ